MNINFKHKDFFIKIFSDDIFIIGGTVRDYLLNNEIENKNKEIVETFFDNNIDEDFRKILKYLDLNWDLKINKKYSYHDIDLMVTNHSYEEIENKLFSYGKINTVGKSFAVIKFTIDDETYDISIPRRDNNTGIGHKDFKIETNDVTIEEDLKRRDFTINSMAIRLSNNELIDPYGGEKDLRLKYLKLTNPEQFKEDPLRVLRAARFASVYILEIDPEIYEISSKCDLSEISGERIYNELIRGLTESNSSGGLIENYLSLTILEKLFPELFKLYITIQEKRWHPETDDDGNHTILKHVISSLDLASLHKNNLTKLEYKCLLLSLLFHDVGKPEVTKYEYKNGNFVLSSKGHNKVGADLAKEILKSLNVDNETIDIVYRLIINHQRIRELYVNRDKISRKSIAKLINEMDGYIDILNLLDYCDRESREEMPSTYKKDEISSWFNDIKHKNFNNEEKIKPIVMGRHLIEKGESPGPSMGEILNKLYDMQLEGEFDNLNAGLIIYNKIREKK